jgi:hypothetical protein
MPHDPAPDAGRRTIPDPGFAGDDGSAHPGLAAALAAYSSDRGRHLEVFLALQGARLLVPVLPVPGDVEGEGEADGDARMRTGKTGDLPTSSEVDMATVLVTGRDGRQAMLGFTSVETLAAWRADARPVPVAASLVALSAMEAGAAALLVDLAGPTTYVVQGDLLEGLARRWVLADTGQGLAFVEEVDEDEVSE